VFAIIQNTADTGVRVIVGPENCTTQPYLNPKQFIGLTADYMVHISIPRAIQFLVTVSQSLHGHYFSFGSSPKTEVRLVSC